MSANTEGMVREGINAFKAGRKDEARALLSKAVELDPYNEDGWLWLSGVVTSVDDQRTCLENVLAINPDNSRARSGLDFLIRQNPMAAPPAVAPAPSPSAPAPASDPEFAPPAATSLPTSIEWEEFEAEEPLDDSGWHQANPAPDDTYDDWMSGLQLGGAAESPAPAPDPFASQTTPASPFFEDDLHEMGETPGLFAEDDPFAHLVAPAAGAEAITFRPPPVAADDNEAASPAYGAAPAASGPAALSASALAGIEVGEDEVLLTSEEMSLFPDIPKEVRPTRLPGTRERVPLLLKIAVFILAPLNVIAAILFFWKLL